MLVGKYFIIGILLLFFCLNANASITSYFVTPNPPLDTLFTVYGQTDQNGGYCAIFIYDQNSGSPIYRLTDPLVTNGVFISSYYKISEGDKLFRDFNYNVTTFCDDGNATQSFTVGQRNTIAFPVQQEVDFLVSPGNLNPILFYGGIGTFLLLIFLLFVYAKRKANNLARFKP